MLCDVQSLIVIAINSIQMPFHGLRLYFMSSSFKSELLLSQKLLMISDIREIWRNSLRSEDKFCLDNDSKGRDEREC